VVAGVIGSPLSGAILNLSGKMGLEGWQWLFLIEGIPAVLMGLAVLFLLPGKPHQAKWLTEEEKNWLQETINSETALSNSSSHSRFIDALTSWKVWLLCLLYFLLNVGGYGFEMWSPTIIKGFADLNFTAVGFINAIPYFVAVIVMLLTGYHSDKTGERRWYVSIAAVVSAIGFALSAYLKNPFLAMAALTVAFAGLKTTVGPFWAFATTFLSGTAAAGGIALINSVGNLGGFVGPTIVGVVTDRTGNPTSSLWILGGALLFMGALILLLRRKVN
jgi:ACS family tartrate transporter-like MFS transporter